MLLDFIGTSGTVVSKNNQLLPIKSLGDLNARLAHPINLGLKRPLQRSHPHISALYVLLRATGIGHVDGTRNKQYVVLDDEILAAWRQLNPTEQFCTLLETWLLRFNLKLMGERSASLFPIIVQWRDFFERIPGKGLRIVGDRNQEARFSYFPIIVNLAVLELFAFVTVQHGKPHQGQGWCITRVEKTSWGEALLHILAQYLLSVEFLADYDFSDEGNFGELQETLQPFFPAWQHNLEIPGHEFHDGVYIFKVSLGRVWRRIAILGKDSLDSLNDAILEAYAFDHDHLCVFSYKNRFGQSTSVHHLYIEQEPFTTEVRIGDLPLQPGTTMTYLYDFGDRWEFDINLERIDPVDRRMRKYRILDIHGQAPEQYPSWDGDEDWHDHESD